MKVGIYHMVLDPKRKSCITLQLDILKKYAKEQSWEVYDTYLDMTNTKEGKVELSRLLQDAHNNCFDIILMKYAYYISRDTSQYVAIRNELRDCGIQLITLCEGKC